MLMMSDFVIRTDGFNQSRGTYRKVGVWFGRQRGEILERTVVGIPTLPGDYDRRATNLLSERTISPIKSLYDEKRGLVAEIMCKKRAKLKSSEEGLP